jgi:carboxymethylenebutenolidase
MSQSAALASALALTFALGGAVASRAAATPNLSDLDRMAAEHQHDQPTATPAATTPPSQPVTSEEVIFGSVYGKPARGFLVRPTPAPRPAAPPGTVPAAPPGGAPAAGGAAAGAAAAGAPLPAVIVIHEWWGLNDNIRDVTKRIAGEGYMALAVDLYDGSVATTPDAAKKLAGGVMANRDAATETLRQAAAFLRKQGAPKLGVIGWCFGGGWSLQTALDPSDKIDAAVMYYGQPEKDHARLAQLHAPLLGFFGADDKSIPPPAVHEMEAALKQMGKQVEVHVYDGAGHAFANPSGTGYRPAAAEDAWQRTVAFFNQYLKS